MLGLWNFPGVNPLSMTLGTLFHFSESPFSHLQNGNDASPSPPMTGWCLSVRHWSHSSWNGPCYTAHNWPSLVTGHHWSPFSFLVSLCPEWVSKLILTHSELYLSLQSPLLHQPWCLPCCVSWWHLSGSFSPYPLLHLCLALEGSGLKRPLKTISGKSGAVLRAAALWCQVAAQPSISALT